MADTIVNTPAPTQDNSAGWAVAVIILLAVIVGGVIWYRYYGHAAPAPAQPSRTNINVSIPTPTSGGDSAGTSDGTTNQ